MWDDSSPKIKHETIRMNFQVGGLKIVLSLSVFSVLGLENYMMVAFMNGR